MFEKKKLKERFFLFKVCLTYNFAEVFSRIEKETNFTYIDHKLNGGSKQWLQNIIHSHEKPGLYIALYLYWFARLC
jgi:hypothetical protein